MARKSKSGNLNYRIRNALRLLFLRSKYRYAIIKASRVDRGVYECHLCLKQFSVVEMQVDHVTPLGIVPKGETWEGWGDYIYRLFHSEMQAICVHCHKKKTKEER